MSLFSNKDESKEEVVRNNSTNHIGKGTEIRGDLETGGIIRIDGKVYGNVKSKSKINLGEGSYVEGNIISQNAEVSGEVKGKLEITDMLILKPSAVISGDIFTGKLIIEAGAVLNGTCKMGDIKSSHINSNSNNNSKLNSNQQKQPTKATV
ncbi:bactofilin family protein [Chondrinema litorale]|uniref:bactofilin family protein n=1 Tax=Chondrinema litorale TaxID=2994555 RepID=UPI0025439E1C|nr:polymer-forming cytoskeletal protein [Chondrinema litorale]UZR95049.1 polymer-forming cytoskeletal protein [Chondrinema litorale]